MRTWLAVTTLAGISASAFGQTFEASLNFGRSLFGGSKTQGTVSADPNSAKYIYKDGFHMALRMTINTKQFMGYEFGYAYNRTSIEIPASAPASAGGQPVVTAAAESVGVPIHHGFANVLLYATPEGTHVRPFVAGGGHFSAFVPPGASVSYGNQTTKFGFNYGGGVKVRTSENWGFRVDGRFYESAKPFQFFNTSGRLRQLELSAGVSFFM